MENFSEEKDPNSTCLKRRRLLAWLPVPFVIAACGGGEDPARPSPSRVMAQLTGPNGTPWTGVGKGGIFIQSPYSSSGDFELLVPDNFGMLHTMRRLNDQNFKWTTIVNDGSGTANILRGAAQTYSTNYNNLEMVVVEKGRIRSYYRGWDTPLEDGSPITVSAQGFPGFVQSRIGGQLRLDLVVGLENGGMAHYCRTDSGGDYSWKLLSQFGSGQVLGVSLIQGNYAGADGNKVLELVTWVDGRLEHWYCLGGSSWARGEVIVPSGVGGAPALIQSTYGTQGNFEVLVPLAAGGISHYVRYNDSANHPWAYGATFGTGRYVAAGLLQAQFGSGNFEAVGLRDTGDVDTFYRQGTGPWAAGYAQSPISYGKLELVGRSDGAFDTGTVGIHSVLLKNGKVLVYGFVQDGVGRLTEPASLVDPVTGTVEPIPTFRDNFCSGHTILADGKVLIVGGHVGDYLKDVVLYDPDTNVAEKVATLSDARWYPSVVMLPDGRAAIIGGSLVNTWSMSINNTWQFYDPQSGLGPSTSMPAPYSPYFPSDLKAMDLYPFTFGLPNGSLFLHVRNTSRFFDANTNTWSPTLYKTVSDNSRSYPFMGGIAALPLSPADNYRVRVVVAGGSDKSANISPSNFSTFDTRTGAMSACEMLDLGDASPAWKSIAPINYPRMAGNLVTLPDGTLFLVGGNHLGKADVGRGPTYPAELYDPKTNTWTVLASTRVARGYHGSALLLPDGRVAITGKDNSYQGAGLRYAETRMEIYSPPYLFKGPRPVIASAPPAIQYGKPFQVPLSASSASVGVGKIVIVRCGSATHQIDFSHRVVELEYSVSGTTALVQGPPNANIAPPGPYMLFVMSSAGVPSVAAIVPVSASGVVNAATVAAQQPSRPSQLASIEAAEDAPRCAPVKVADASSASGREQT
ncbi:DUF1929 domain-containing protein (plasmid) [Burkholderia ambifaria]|uniref:galactose oxidase-like domain-containing protein n=1 Tax=Burkholderia ambifaria TaxID=152480 RepID=UPI001E301655|nr:galactose oxidase-like domain-containing protein [Burkholderia ambifaria]UEP39795.1 DUF1929 domain-containing protein [Burkholderia ambifaria]